MALNVSEFLPDVYPCTVKVKKRGGAKDFAFFVREPSAEEVFDDLDAKAKTDADTKAAVDKAEANGEAAATPDSTATARRNIREAIEKYVVSDIEGTHLTKDEVDSMMKLSMPTLMKVQEKIRDAVGLTADEDEAKKD